MPLKERVSVPPGLNIFVTRIPGVSLRFTPGSNPTHLRRLLLHAPAGHRNRARSEAKRNSGLYIAKADQAPERGDGRIDGRIDGPSRGLRFRHPFGVTSFCDPDSGSSLRFTPGSNPTHLRRSSEPLRRAKRECGSRLCAAIGRGASAPPTFGDVRRATMTKRQFDKPPLVD
jgi:hypothetical protein